MHSSFNHCKYGIVVLIYVLHVVEAPFRCGIYLSGNDTNVFNLMEHSGVSLLAFLKIDLALRAALPLYTNIIWIMLK